jgi:hypothetical protein
MDRYWSGDPSAGVDVALKPSNYLVLDLIGAALVHVLGPHAAFRFLSVIIAIVPGVGLYTLLRTIAPTVRGWATVGLLLGINRYFLVGYLNYQLGLGLAFFWLALFWHFKTRPSWSRFIGLAALGVALSQVHLSSIAFLVIVVACDAVADARQAHGKGGMRAALSGALLPIATLAVPLLVAVLTPSGRVGGSGLRVFEFRTPARKVVQFVAPFFTLSMTQSAMLLIGYAASLATFLWFVCRPGRWNRHLLTVAVLLACYAAFPLRIHGTYDLDVRFLIPAFLLAFIARTPDEGGDQVARRGLVVPLFACLLQSGLVTIESHRMDRDLRVLHRSLQQIPPGKKVLEVVAERPDFGVPYYNHFSSWYVIEKKGQVSGTYSASSAPYMEHFRFIKPIRYEPELGWRLVGQPPRIDPLRLAQTYDYVVLIGDDPATIAEIMRGAQIVERNGRVTLFEVARPRAAGARPDIPTGWDLEAGQDATLGHSD